MYEDVSPCVGTLLIFPTFCAQPSPARQRVLCKNEQRLWHELRAGALRGHANSSQLALFVVYQVLDKLFEQRRHLLDALVAQERSGPEIAAAFIADAAATMAKSRYGPTNTWSALRAPHTPPLLAFLCPMSQMGPETKGEDRRGRGRKVQRLRK